MENAGEEIKLEPKVRRLADRADQRWRAALEVEEAITNTPRKVKPGLQLRFLSLVL